MAYKGGARPKAQLSYNYNKYTPKGLEDLSEKELRKEYSRLRSINRKRMERMANSPDYKDSEILKENANKFGVTKSIKTEAQLRHKLADLARLVQSDRGSIKGQNKIRDKAIKTFHADGYDFINKKNFKEVTKFLNRAKEINKSLAKASDQLLDYYDMLKKQGADPQSLEKALKDFSRSRTPDNLIQNTNKRDARQFRQALE